MAVKGIHHLGVAVEDLAGAAALYARLFGAELERREELPDQGVDVASLRVGDSHIELLSPLAADTPVGRFLAGRGPGMHHVAFAVEDVGAELVRLRAGGAELVDDEPRPGAFGTTVAFVHPNAAGGVLAELVSDG
ncbi:MAG TPA: methylmalonyl-CoA epimerase [Gaiellaceae bacterium]|nr:methylmalonyl-CoA epimerase [Gaiellaceae bacterium]